MELPPGTAHEARPPQLRAEFDGTSGCIPRARRAAAAFLRHHAPAVRHDDVLLVVSELVTNAVRHASGPFVLKLGLLPGGVGITVRDTSPSLPHPRPPDRTGGRGWPIVLRLAHRVDVVPHRDGKSVHAELAWQPHVV
jgi:anti-sigma regulatory factor (Ser/Thr protein kinase)